MMKPSKESQGTNEEQIIKLKESQNVILKEVAANEKKLDKIKETSQKLQKVR